MPLAPLGFWSGGKIAHKACYLNGDFSSFEAGTMVSWEFLGYKKYIFHFEYRCFELDDLVDVELAMVNSY